ncbi:aromatic amino acid ammonia-lyase [Capnocytophaga canimorsus]|uniref:aromatic amino acid ammonia-lyase n=1 Tax=Capnocytophaga canimorsus TaxID=28188 RepID=UPI001561BFFF|nr:aromatic amino acid ammonia-lyase [Capnocytophaga canimorsus]MDT9498585.1 aromatic amino acid lyase [Capnocytophaga canimorsus]GJQ04938.1 histidine ammonia-lyase [Capnocytophaga canimorsus]
MIHYISNETLNLERLEVIISEGVKLKLSEEAVVNIEKSYTYLQNRLKNATNPIENVVSASCFDSNGKILPQKISENQHNLLKSYACGFGRTAPDTIVKLMLFLKIQSLSYGYSGVHLKTVERLIDFFNNDILPVVYLEGAPDDRISLANMALPLIGEGEVRINGKVFSACELEAQYGWRSLQLGAKEGEALLVGTQLTTAYAVYCLIKSLKICVLSDFIASLSADVFGADASPFLAEVQAVRPHKGQILTAKNLRTFLSNNEKKEQYVPEAFYAIPQVHGAVKDAIAAVRKVIRTEINSATDNTLIFQELNAIFYGGNSHTLPLSFALDYLAIALTGLGNISERRTFHLINKTEHLPNKKTLDFWVLQRMGEGISVENKHLAVPTSAENPMLIEKRFDIKGMGGSAAVKCYQLVENIQQLLAIELLTAMLFLENQFDENDVKRVILQDFRNDLKINKKSFSLKKSLEKTIRFLENFDFSHQIFQNSKI